MPWQIDNFPMIAISIFETSPIHFKMNCDYFENKFLSYLMRLKFQKLIARCKNIST